MRKIILDVAVSLDGLIEGPKGEYDWCFTDQDYGLSEMLKRVDTAFIGRKTYELTLQMNEKDGSGLPKLKQYVFSTTLDKVRKGEILIKENIKAEVEKIKNEKGKDIWLFGGASLTTSLINLGLVDELALAVHPILLGSGKPLFKDIKDRIKLTLVDTRKFATGLVTLNYKIGYKQDFPDSDMGCHPSDIKKGAPSGTQDISFYCENIEETIKEFKAKGVSFKGDIEDRGYGKTAFFKVPGNFYIQLYEPHYKK